MKSKKPSSAKVVDISRPKKRTALAEAPSAPQLVIPKRASLIIPITEEEALEATTSAPEALKTRQTSKVVLPQTAPALPVAGPEQAPVVPAQEQAVPKPPAPTQPVAEQPAPTPPTPPQPAAAQSSAPRIEPPQPKPAAEPQPQPAAKAPAPAEKSPEPESPETSTKSAKTHGNVQKALEDAKHQEEIQGYIDTHKFFVPINARARKRSLRVSIALTFVELALGLILLNLMLDAGLIELLEKIPHTNFFNLH